MSKCSVQEEQVQNSNLKSGAAIKNSYYDEYDEQEWLNSLQLEAHSG